MSIAPAAFMRFVRFGSVGASGVMVNQAVLWFGREHLFSGMSPWLALNASLAVAISLATVNNFLWNRLWTWSDRFPARSLLGTLEQFGQYCVAVLLSATLQVVLTNFFAAFLQYLVANLCAIALASGVNFAINNRWTFRGRAAAAPALPLESPP
jgi:dolichol-phosphate mannosyltransferase